MTSMAQYLYLLGDYAPETLLFERVHWLLPDNPLE